jgi:hypothetical protein
MSSRFEIYSFDDILREANTHMSRKIWEDYLIGEVSIQDGLPFSKRAQDVYRRNKNYFQFLWENSPRSLKREAHCDHANLMLYRMCQTSQVPSKLVYFMVCEGADVNYTPDTLLLEDDTHLTPIHLLSKDVNCKSLKLLKNLDCLTSSSISQTTGIKKRTALHMAVTNENYSIEQWKTVDLLCSILSNGNRIIRESIDAHDHTGQTALFIAFATHNYRIVKVLLEHQASVLSNLEEFAERIPLIKIVFEEISTWRGNSPSSSSASSTSIQSSKQREIISQLQQSLPRLQQHSLLQPLFALNEISSQLIDYHHSLWILDYYKYRYYQNNVLKFMEGMILFRLREELRQSKQSKNSSVLLPLIPMDNFQKQQEEIDRMKEDKEEEEKDEEYVVDLQKRQIAHKIHRDIKRNTVQSKRKHQNELDWQQRHQKHKEQVEKQFQLKISRISVG